MLDLTEAINNPHSPAQAAAADVAYEWQQSRRRPDGKFHTPVGGFGSGGLYTIWLPSTRPDVRFRIVNGEPVREIVSDCFSDQPEIAAARDEIIRTFRSVNGVYSADTAFIRYTVAVIKSNYTVTDDDLTFLLDGKKWHDSMMKHALGGDDLVRVMASIRQTAPAPLPAAITASPAVSPVPVPRKRSAIGRAVDAALNLIGLKLSN